MNQELELAPADSSEGEAAAAFEQMTTRLSLLEAAITGLAAQRSAIDIPDYSETLGEIASDVEDAAEALEKLATSPLLMLTPEQTARQISQAGKDVRAADHSALAQAQTIMDGWARSISDTLASARTAQAQRQQLIRVSGVGTVAGILLWAILPGPVARALPTSWHLPERMAIRTLGLDPWAAGEHLLATAEPDHWRIAVTASHIFEDNHAVLTRCIRAADKAGKEVRCTIAVKAGR